MIITLAGHVDHGKTALVKALTGTNTDRLAEEQQRGLTIDLGFAYANLNGERVGFVDVPGHHRFIHNMIAGVAAMQHALLVIAADDGPMPQSQEHLQILELLGLHQGTVVLNKIDKVSSERLKGARNEVNTLLAGSFLDGAPVIESSATTGDGIDALKERLSNVANSFRTRAQPREFRMPVDRCFALPGIGTIVTGTVTEGSVSVGDQVVINSESQKCRVRSLNVQNVSAVDATAGDRCSLNLAGVNSSSVNRGDWVTTSEAHFSATVASVRINVISNFPRAISHWAPVHVYHFCGHSEARIALPRNTKLNPAASDYAEIVCTNPMHFKIGDRLILRDADLQSTLGGATVLSVHTRRSKNRDSNWRADLAKLDEAVSNQNIGRSLELVSQELPGNLDEFRRCWNLSVPQFEESIGHGNIVTTNGQFLNGAFVKSLTAQLRESLAKFHESDPTSTGASLHHLSTLVRRDRDLVELVLDLSLNQEFKRIGGMYSLFNYEPEKPRFNVQLYERIRDLIDLDQPNSSGDVAKKLGIPYHVIEHELGAMCRAGKFIKVARNRYFTPDQLNKLISLAKELSNEQGFTVRDFRDASGLGRNWVVDVLEYFDRNQFTRRKDNYRVATTKII